MKKIALVGAQWGDEGKGKITDLLAERADLVIRYQGGHNAGHTIWVNGKKTVLHVIPSGVLHPHCESIIGHGVVFEPENFLKELVNVQSLAKIGPDQLKISANATVITHYHRLIDQARESKADNKIGTTGKGIGPAYEDKVGRRAIKVKDLFDKDQLIRRLSVGFSETAFLLKEFYHMDVPKLDDEVERLYQLGSKFKDYVTDTFTYLYEAHRQNKKMLFEGAQGVLLDIDYGTYPYVTSSSSAFGGIHSGAGLPYREIDEVIGVAKAYTTRVGEGPFPTEISSEIGQIIQEKGQEFGATTGRKRRCGWLDLPLLKYAVHCSQLTTLALTKLDILSGLSELKICTGYEVNNKIIYEAYPGINLFHAKPILKSFTPFKDDFKTENFSTELKIYLDFIESEIKIPLNILAFGPDRKEIVLKKSFF